MPRMLLTVAAIATIISADLSTKTRAADLQPLPAWKRSAHFKSPYKSCTRYYCYPLYGAYGPFGGMAYWGAYTDAGWGYRRW
jgi:hypothetical protein